MRTRVLNKFQKYIFILPILIITVSWIYLFLSSQIFKVGFNYFLDDHYILLSHSYFSNIHDIFFDPFATLFSPEPKLRFRPLYDVFIRFFTQAYGLRPFIWYLSSCVVAIITSLLFYLMGRLQNFSYLESILFTSLIVFGPQASTYTRFGTPETTSTLLIALALFIASFRVNHKLFQIFLNGLFVLFSIMASLNKEACILMLPALAFFKVWYPSWKNKKYLRKILFQNIKTVLFMTTMFLIFLAYILVNVSGPGYAGIDNNTLSLTNYINLLIANQSAFGLILIANFICGIIYFKNIYSNKFNFNIRVLGFYIFSGLIVIPQIILYSKSGLNAHYLLPVSIGFSWLTIYPLNQIRKKRTLYSKILAFILTIIIVILITNQFIWTKRHFTGVAVGVNDINQMLQDISSCTKNNSSLIIFANPYIDYERIYAFKIISDKIFSNDQVFLATYGSRNSHFTTDVIKGEDKLHFFNPKNLENFYNNQTIKSLTKENLEEIQGIVLTNSREFEKDFTQLKIDGLKLNLFSSKYYETMNISFYCRIKNTSVRIPFSSTETTDVNVVGVNGR